MSPISEAVVDNLRERMSVLERDVAVTQESQRSIISRLDKIESTLSRLNWLLIGAIIAAAASFIIRGGLVGLPPVT